MKHLRRRTSNEELLGKNSGWYAQPAELDETVGMPSPSLVVYSVVRSGILNAYIREMVVRVNKEEMR